MAAVTSTLCELEGPEKAENERLLKIWISCLKEKNNSKLNEVKVDPVQETKVVSVTRKCMIKLSKNKTNIENFIRLLVNMAEEAKVITTFLPLNLNTYFQEREVLEAQ